MGQLPAQVAALRPKSSMAPAAAAGKPTTPDDLANATKSSLDDFESMIGRSHWDLFRCLMHFSQEGALKDYRFDKIEDCPPLPEVTDPVRSTPVATPSDSPAPTEVRTDGPGG